ncbi:death domain-associated protein 6-like isoform X2 [Prorops nasuta]|uniref:death domain-associated protein 6-like isoform X2 n=1 Tax=Prorops nasuta TaxID=863751 RepID=UPI0034CF5374
MLSVIMGVEVICISSDEDGGTYKDTTVPNKVPEGDISEHEIKSTIKMEVDTDANVNILRNFKRNYPQDMETASTSSSHMAKRLKPINISLKPVKTEYLNVNNTQNGSSTGNKSQEIISKFIDLCMEKECSIEMEKIVGKLRRRYDKLDIHKKNSQKLIDYLTRKYTCLVKSKGLYYHIKGVMDKLKEINHLDILSVNDDTEKNNDEEATAAPGNDLESTDVLKVDKMTNKIAMALRKVQARIKELEVAEVNFDDEENSENPDAGRPILRPKHFAPTGIPIVDQAITNFINHNIARRKKLHPRAYDNTNIIPDYKDILDCIVRVNTMQNLGFNQTKIDDLAVTAFKQVAEHLQRLRKNDYWDTFSLYLDDGKEDPANNDENLKIILDRNYKLGQERIQEVITSYVRKQEELQNNNPNSLELLE